VKATENYRENDPLLLVLAHCPEGIYINGGAQLCVMLLSGKIIDASRSKCKRTYKQ
jgi:hypothetical protein